MALVLVVSPLDAFGRPAQPLSHSLRVLGLQRMVHRSDEKFVRGRFLGLAGGGSLGDTACRIS
jgi:hypothetical protein